MPNTIKGVEIDPVREKLIELVEQGYNKYANPNCEGDLFAVIADHLIANGVTIETECHWATEQAYKNGYLKGYDKGLEDALDITIVRCKECKHTERLWGQMCCPYTGDRAVADNHFCSYGERKVENG